MKHHRHRLHPTPSKRQEYLFTYKRLEFTASSHHFTAYLSLSGQPKTNLSRYNVTLIMNSLVDRLTSMSESGDIGRKSATLAPIESLPNELLAHIFTLGTYSRTGPFEVLPFALLVSCITRRFRNIAISSPSVWSNLVFSTSVHSDNWCADIYLPRSGAHPLDITVELLGRSTERVMDIIVPHSARWRSLSVKAWTRSDLEIILKSLRDVTAPLLDKIELRCFLGDQECSWDPHQPCLTLGTPALRSVRLRGLCLKCGPQSLANLTTFHFDSHDSSLSYAELTNLLAASPALRTLVLRLPRFEATELTPINIPCLRSLTMNFLSSGDTFVHLFAMIVAPALECLELISMDGGQVLTLVEYCRRSPTYPRPQTLKLFNIADDFPDILHGFFHIFPSVTSLYRIGTPIEPIKTYFPALKRITYDTNLYFPLGENQLGWIHTIVEDRKSASQPISQVRIARHLCAGDALNRLRDLIEVVDIEDDADSLQYTGQSDDGEDNDFAEDLTDIHDGMSDYSGGEWGDEGYEYESEDVDEWFSD